MQYLHTANYKGLQGKKGRNFRSKVRYIKMSILPKLNHMYIITPSKVPACICVKVDKLSLNRTVGVKIWHSR